MNTFKELKPAELQDNPFKLIGSDWMLITAGMEGAFNTMTASWGGLGVLWEQDVAFAFVRPTRHTFGFMEQAPVFTLSFFAEQHRPALDYCGTHSGRDVNKVARTGMTPEFGPAGEIYFAEARLVLVCRKLHAQDLDPAGFRDPALAGFYPQRDYHRLYVGGILRALAR